MFTAGVAVLGCSAKGSDCGINPMVRAFSIAFKRSCGFMLSTYRKVFAIQNIYIESVRIFEYNNSDTLSVFMEDIEWSI